MYIEAFNAWTFTCRAWRTLLHYGYDTTSNQTSDHKNMAGTGRSTSHWRMCALYAQRGCQQPRKAKMLKPPNHHERKWCRHSNNTRPCYGHHKQTRPCSMRYQSDRTQLSDCVSMCAGRTRSSRQGPRRNLRDALGGGGRSNICHHAIITTGGQRS